jgi:phage nucleotide-binding protein
MAVNLMSTKDVILDGVKALIYGQSKAGKTTLLGTLPESETVILSAESGLLSLGDKDIAVIEITSFSDLTEAYDYLTENEIGKGFKNVCLDSITEIADVVLAYEKSQTKDGRQAYGALIEKMQILLRSFRDLKGRNVVFIAQLDKTSDEMGRVFYGASMPGSKLGAKSPYYFDVTAAMTVMKDDQGNSFRALMCQSDGMWTAGCRAIGNNIPDMYEEPNLSKLFAKLKGGNN